MRIQFTPNYDKILEVVLWIANQCKEMNQGRGINQYNLLKAIFHADYISVNKYERPVTGDTYFALQYGTVPDAIYNGLIEKKPQYIIGCFGTTEIPLEIKDSYYLYPQRKADEDYLSGSDIECLQEGIKEYANLSFKEAHDKNHENKAYLKTYSNTPNSPIDWYDLIEDSEIREELVGISKYIVL